MLSLISVARQTDVPKSLYSVFFDSSNNLFLNGFIDDL